MSRSVQLAIPEKFDGTPDRCEGFLLQCSLYFVNQHSAFLDDAANIAFVITLLTGKVLQWVSAVWKQQGTITCSLGTLLAHFKDVFNHPAEGRGAGEQLLTLLFPCVFFSRKLYSAERNYDIGNREQLAVKLAFEQWRHWLEGTHHAFLVLTDHRNLEYIRSAKRLNP
ncbi:RTL8B protein, partial [Amia calva]|nr:RTL8B protein [Amia calva]